MVIHEELIGENIVLRTACVSDVNDNYFNWMNDYETNLYMETHWEEQSVNSIIKFVEKNEKSDDNYLFAIYKKNNKHIGNIKLGPIVERYKYADISYFIGDKEERGKGYAKEAVHIVVDFAFNRLNCHRLQAGVIEGNISSEKVLLGAGFKLKGRLEQKLIRNGKYLDHLIFGLVNSKQNTKNISCS